MGLALDIPAAWTCWKSHSFPPPRLWQGCPPPGMPFRLWNLALAPGALRGERGRVHPSPLGAGAGGARWSQSNQCPMPMGQFRPSVPSSPNPYSKRASETEGKGEKETGRNSGRNRLTGKGGGGVAGAWGSGRDRQRATRWSPECAEVRDAPASLSPALWGQSWIPPPGFYPSASDRPQHSRLITTRGGAGSSAPSHRSAPALPRPLGSKEAEEGDGPKTWAQPMAVRAVYKEANRSKSPPLEGRAWGEPEGWGGGIPPESHK